MNSVILASQSTDLARRVRIASEDRLTVIQPEQLPVGPAQLLALANEPESVDVVLVDVRGDEDLLQQALELATRFERHQPGVGLLLVSEDAEHIGLRALRAGVRDVLEPGADVADIRWALRRATDVVQAPAAAADSGPEYSSRVITIASPKGGVGKTTIATNIARTLAEQSPSGTVLVDLDTQFGDVAAALDLAPEYSVGDLVEGPALSDPLALKTLLARHSSGLYVATGVESPEDADRVTPDRIALLLHILRQEFRYVVLDTAPGLSEQTLTALDHTTDLVLVTSLDVPGVRGLHKELDVLDKLSLPPHTRHVIVNNADRMSGLSVKDVESTIGRRVDLVVPRSAVMLRSTNVGSPVVESSPRDKVSRDLVTFAHRFSVAAGHGERTRWRRGR